MMQTTDAQWDIAPARSPLKALQIMRAECGLFRMVMTITSCLIAGFLFAGLLFLRAPKVYKSKCTFLVVDLPFARPSGAIDAETERALVQSLILSILNKNIKSAVAGSLGVSPDRIAFSGVDRPLSLKGHLPLANVEAGAIKNSRLGSITVESQDAEFSADVANHILGELGLFNSIGWRLHGMQSELNILKTQSDNLSQRLAEVVSGAAKSRQENMELESYLAKKLPLYSYPSFAQDSSMINLKTQLMIVESQYKYLASTSTRGPRLDGKKAELMILRNHLESMAMQLKDALRSNYQIQNKQAESLQSDLERIFKKSLALSEKASLLEHSFGDPVEMRRLASDPDLNARGPETNNVIDIVDKATPPTHPTSPILALYMMAGGILGLVMGVGLLFLQEVPEVRKIEESGRCPSEP